MPEPVTEFIIKLTLSRVKKMQTKPLLVRDDAWFGNVEIL